MQTIDITNEDVKAEGPGEVTDIAARIVARKLGFTEGYTAKLDDTGKNMIVTYTVPVNFEFPNA